MIQLLIVATLFLFVVGVFIYMIYSMTRGIMKDIKNNNSNETPQPDPQPITGIPLNTPPQPQDKKNKHPILDMIAGICGILFMFYMFNTDKSTSVDNFVVQQNPGQSYQTKNMPIKTKSQELPKTMPAVSKETKPILNANNYKTFPADFEFGSFALGIAKLRKDGQSLESLLKIDLATYLRLFTDSLNATGKPIYELWCENELDDLRCVYMLYNEIGKKKSTKDKYLGKIVKTPLLNETYSNGESDDIYLSDVGAGGLPAIYSIQCHLTNPDNIADYLDKVGKKRAITNMIGKISNIDSFHSAITLDPCYFIDVVR